MWGIWNGEHKRFVFNIKETSKRQAHKRLAEKGRRLSYMHRYEAREIPEGWINPPNPTNYKGVL